MSYYEALTLCFVAVAIGAYHLGKICERRLHGTRLARCVPLRQSAPGRIWRRHCMRGRGRGTWSRWDM